MHWHRITGTIKGLPDRMIRIGFEIGHFDHHPVWSAAAVGADLFTYPLSSGVKGSAGNCTKLIDQTKPRGRDAGDDRRSHAGRD